MKYGLQYCTDGATALLYKFQSQLCQLLVVCGAVSSNKYAAFTEAPVSYYLVLCVSQPITIHFYLLSLIYAGPDDNSSTTCHY